MTSNIHILIFLTLLLGCTGLKESTSKNKEVVQCYVSNSEENRLLVYDAIDGNLIEELKPIENGAKDFCWYQFDVAQFKQGYFKIENVQVVPCSRYELAEYNGSWLKANGILKTDVQIYPSSTGETHQVPIYSKPRTNSSVKLFLKEYVQARLLDVSGSWAKISFESQNKTFEGWVEDIHRCHLPYTACN